MSRSGTFRTPEYILMDEPQNHINYHMLRNFVNKPVKSIADAQILSLSPYSMTSAEIQLIAEHYKINIPKIEGTPSDAERLKLAKIVNDYLTKTHETLWGGRSKSKRSQIVRRKNRLSNRRY